MKRYDLSNNRPVIAMLQPPPLPGSPRYSGERPADLVKRCLTDAELLVNTGFDGLQLQNMGDEPGARQVGPETVAFMSVLASKVRAGFPDINLSILVNWDGPATVAVAEAAEADFARIEHTFVGATVTAWGISEACCREVMRLRSRIGSSMPIAADVIEPHGLPLVEQPVVAMAVAAVTNGANALYITGGDFDESVRHIRDVREALPTTPVYLGGGATPDNVGRVLAVADGVTVGSWIRGGSPDGQLDEQRVKAFMDAVQHARAQG